MKNILGTLLLIYGLIFGLLELFKSITQNVHWDNKDDSYIFFMSFVYGIILPNTFAYFLLNSNQRNSKNSLDEFLTDLFQKTFLICSYIYLFFGFLFSLMFFFSFNYDKYFRAIDLKARNNLEVIALHTCFPMICLMGFLMLKHARKIKKALGSN